MIETTRHNAPHPSGENRALRRLRRPDRGVGVTRKAANPNATRRIRYATRKMGDARWEQTPRKGPQR